MRKQCIVMLMILFTSQLAQAQNSADVKAEKNRIDTMKKSMTTCLSTDRKTNISPVWYEDIDASVSADVSVAVFQNKTGDWRVVLTQKSVPQSDAQKDTSQMTAEELYKWQQKMKAYRMIDQDAIRQMRGSLGHCQKFFWDGHSNLKTKWARTYQYRIR